MDASSPTPGTKRGIRALALLSGGLDSSLALKAILDQGVEVIALHFFTPFCLCDRGYGCGYTARALADTLGVPIKIIYLGEEYLEMLKKPKHGYGSQMNPCIDCRIMMFKKAKEKMKELGAQFLVTGEVLGQRPMSQRRDAIDLIERETGLKGLILRPLSAKLLPPTIPEEKGWIDREKLFKIKGRSRKAQMELAKIYGIHDYPCPSGGCLLTDPSFAKRMKDLLEYSDPTLNDIHLLKVGRHFRIDPSTKIIVGRNKEENDRLLTLAREGDIILEVEGYKGPITLLRGRETLETLHIAAGITARYSDAPRNEQVEVSYRKAGKGEKAKISVKSIREEVLEDLRI